MADTMKAQVFYEAEKMEMAEVPIPQVGEADVLVKVKNCGICGSDISYFFGFSPTGKMPIMLGHEFTGRGGRSRRDRRRAWGCSSRATAWSSTRCSTATPATPAPAATPTCCSNFYVPGVNADARVRRVRALALHRPVQAGRQRQLRGRRVHRAAGVRGLRHEQAGDRTGPARGRSSAPAPSAS